MRCETCKGTGKTEHRSCFIAGLAYTHSMLPCPDCGGTGFAHCCEGLRETPEAGAGEESEQKRDDGNER